MSIVRSSLWILIVPAVILTSAFLVMILVPYITQGEVVSFGYYLGMMGIVMDTVSAIIIFLRLGLRLKTLDRADGASIVALAIGAMLVIFG